MDINFTLKELLLYQVALFSVFSPSLSLIEDYRSGIKNKIAFRIGLYTVINLTLIAWLG